MCSILVRNLDRFEGALLIRGIYFFFICLVLVIPQKICAQKFVLRAQHALGERDFHSPWSDITLRTTSPQELRLEALPEAFPKHFPLRVKHPAIARLVKILERDPESVRQVFLQYDPSFQLVGLYPALNVERLLFETNPFHPVGNRLQIVESTDYKTDLLTAPQELAPEDSTYFVHITFTGPHPQWEMPIPVRVISIQQGTAAFVIENDLQAALLDTVNRNLAPDPTPSPESVMATTPQPKEVPIYQAPATLLRIPERSAFATATRYLERVRLNHILLTPHNELSFRDSIQLRGYQAFIERDRTIEKFKTGRLLEIRPDTLLGLGLISPSFVEACVRSLSLHPYASTRPE